MASVLRISDSTGRKYIGIRLDNFVEATNCSSLLRLTRSCSFWDSASAICSRLKDEEENSLRRSSRNLRSSGEIDGRPWRGLLDVDLVPSLGVVRSIGD